jgi:hypothetical protein
MTRLGFQLAAALLAATTRLAAAEIKAASCSETDVQAAVDRAVDGDAVSVPAGDSTWDHGVAIRGKTLTLTGAGSGAGGTHIAYGGKGHTLLIVDAGAKTGRMEVSGFWLTGGDADYWSGAALQIGGPAGWKKLRIHDMLFESNRQWSIRGSAATCGVIDHCTFKGKAHGANLSGRGDLDWSTPLVLGSDDFFFFEDNDFEFDDWYGQTGAAALDFVNGGRIVFRHNRLKYSFFETHDRLRSGLPSANAYEVYQNTFWSDSAKWKGIDLTAGSGVVWGNQFTGPYAVPIGGMDYKSILPGERDFRVSKTKPADGTDPVDQNTPGQSGWRTQYQIGSQGQGPDATGYPLYLWSNTANGRPVTLIVTTGANHIKAGRDFIDNGTTPKPGYTPFTYPHPLTQP